jgi:hypothetical protein
MTWTTLALTNSDQAYNDRNGTDDLDDKMTSKPIRVWFFHCDRNETIKSRTPFDEKKKKKKEKKNAHSQKKQTWHPHWIYAGRTTCHIANLCTMILKSE